MAFAHQHVFDGLFEFVEPVAFFDKAIGAQFHRQFQGLFADGAGEENDFCLGQFLAEQTQDFEAIDLG